MTGATAMSGVYFLILAVLAVAAFFVGMQRARAMRALGSAAIHSLPTYHGLFLASACCVAMLAIFVIGAPLGARYIHAAALSPFDATELADPLKIGALLRDVSSSPMDFIKAKRPHDEGRGRGLSRRDKPR